MKATAIGLCVAAGLGFAVTLGAQSQTASLKPGEIAVTGCLQKSADGMFALTNAQIDPAASGLPGASASGATGSGSTATTGTTGTTATKPMTYSLQAGTADLATHVGHKVQITGKPEAMSSSGAATGASGSTNAPSSGAAGAPQSGSSSSSTSAANPKLDVSAVKMIATTCP